MSGLGVIGDRVLDYILDAALIVNLQSVIVAHNSMAETLLKYDSIHEKPLVGVPLKYVFPNLNLFAPMSITTAPQVFRHQLVRKYDGQEMQITIYSIGWHRQQLRFAVDETFITLLLVNESEPPRVGIASSTTARTISAEASASALDWAKVLKTKILLPPKAALAFPLSAQVNNDPLASSTSWAIVQALYYSEIRRNVETAGELAWNGLLPTHSVFPYGAFFRSAMFLYYHQRKMNGQEDKDSGASLLDGFKVLRSIGACSQTSWPYVVENVTLPPFSDCYDEARNKPLRLNVKRVSQDLLSLQACIATGYVVLFGFYVYESAEPTTDNTGSSVRLPVPNNLKEELTGTATGLLTFYDDDQQVFGFLESTLSPSGKNTIPYEYILRSDLARDFWTVAIR